MTTNPKKLNWETIRAIRSSYVAAEGSTPTLGTRYGVSGSMIHRIIHNRAWHDPSYTPPARSPLGGPEAGERNSGAKLTWPQVRDIRLRYSGGHVRMKSLADTHGVSRMAISLIIRNKTWIDPAYTPPTRSKDTR